MSRLQALAAIIPMVAALSGCATEQRGSAKAVNPGATSPPTESTPPSTSGEQWACSPGLGYGFVTDPVIYPADSSQAEVASNINRSKVEEGLDEETFDVDRNTGASGLRDVSERAGSHRATPRVREERVGRLARRARPCLLDAR